MDVLRSVAAVATAALAPRQGSRFAATIAPVDDEDAARDVVAASRRRDPDASHHCWAFRLADGRALVDDDGEPGGTAGAPILRHLEGANLHDVVVVVVRWFGGTKLGTGGLVRAYGDATAMAIQSARVVERPVTVTVEIVHDFDLTGPVEAVLARHRARELSADYTSRVQRRVAVPRSLADAFAIELRDATAGRVLARSPDTPSSEEVT